MNRLIVTVFLFRTILFTEFSHLLFYWVILQDKNTSICFFLVKNHRGTWVTDPRQNICFNLGLFLWYMLAKITCRSKEMGKDYSKMVSGKLLQNVVWCRRKLTLMWKRLLFFQHNTWAPHKINIQCVNRPCIQPANIINTVHVGGEHHWGRWTR